MIAKELLQVGETVLAKAGCWDSRIDAEIIMMHLLSIDRQQLFLKLPNLLDEKTCEGYFALIDLRASGTPVQYITGEQDFMGITFRVNEHVLIPRQDTETLVEYVLEKGKELLDHHKVGNGGLQILDLCCGSGAIAVSLSKLLINAKVSALDISKEALAVAKENAASAGAGKSIKFIEGDLFSSLKKGIGKPTYHMIVSNPPYIRSEVIPTLQREVAEHEPMLALDGGEDGLDFYRRIIEEAPQYLKKEGLLYLEIGHDQGAEVSQLAQNGGMFEEIQVIQDLAGKDRIVTCKLKPKEKKRKTKEKNKSLKS